MNISNQLIEKVLLSGAIGAVHYWVLKEFNLFYFYKQKNESDRNYLISLLALQNYWFLGLLKKITKNQWNFELYYVSSFLISLVISFIVFNIFNCIMLYLNKKSLDKRKAYNQYFSPLDRIFEKDLSNYDNYIVITDLNGDILEHGYLKFVSSELGELEFVVRPGDWSHMPIEFNEFREGIDEDWEVYISVRDKIKVYVIKDDKDRV